MLGLFTKKATGFKNIGIVKVKLQLLMIYSNRTNCLHISTHISIGLHMNGFQKQLDNLSNCKGKATFAYDWLSEINCYRT